MTTATPSTPQPEDTHPRRGPVQVIFIALGIALGLFVIYRVQAVILALIMAIFFAYLIAPLVFLAERTLRRLKAPRGLTRALAIGLVYLAMLSTVGLTLLVLVPKLTQQATDIMEQTPEYVTAVRSWGERWSSYERAKLPEDVRAHVDEAIVKTSEAAVLYAKDTLLEVAAMLALIPWLVLIPVLAFFLLKDLDVMRYYAVQALPARLRGPGYKLVQELNTALASYVRAQLLACLIIGAACTIGFAALRVPYAALLGALAGVLEFIPLVGPLIVAVVTAVIAGVSSPTLAIWVVVFLVVLRIAEDYVIYPRLMGHGTHLHPLSIIVAVLAGAELGGVVGIFLAVPAASACSVGYRHWIDWRTDTARHTTTEHHSATSSTR